MSTYLDLYDYRCRVAAMYVEQRDSLQAGENSEMVWQRLRFRKDALLRTHPQSPLDEEQRRTFQSLAYFPYRPEFCVPARVETDVEHEQLAFAQDGDKEISMTIVGRLHFTIQGQQVALVFYWLNVYGGGLFLPFRDTTCPFESYGGGRYLFDTIKGSTPLPLPGADLQQYMLLDFNYAYNPSCAYNDRWVCPLAPLDNHLKVAIRAGEKKFSPGLERQSGMPLARG